MNRDGYETPSSEEDTAKPYPSTQSVDDDDEEMQSPSSEDDEEGAIGAGPGGVLIYGSPNVLSPPRLVIPGAPLRHPPPPRPGLYSPQRLRTLFQMSYPSPNTPNLYSKKLPKISPQQQPPQRLVWWEYRHGLFPDGDDEEDGVNGDDEEEDDEEEDEEPPPRPDTPPSPDRRMRRREFGRRRRSLRRRPDAVAHQYLNMYWCGASRRVA